MRAALLALLAFGLAAAAPTPAARQAPTVRAEVVRSFPHDTGAFTQGLFVANGQLFESTGQYGQSTVRRVELATGRVLQRAALPAGVFGEGSAPWKDRLIVLTWTNRGGFELDRRTFAVRRTFAYSGEGWGLTADPRRLIMSDGTATLRFLDPETLKETGRVTVTDAGAPVTQLNELEYVRGEVLANVWMTERIARIDPATGRVKGWLDLTGVLPAAAQGGPENVLNGIAYDAAADRLYVTGGWPRLFEIRRPRP